MTEVVPAALLLPFIGALGLAIGSFLNVVIYRVPAGLSVVSPPSACPRCEHPIRERDNIPVVSWMMLRGKCRDCAAPISARYPAVEAVTGLLFVAVAAAATSWPLLVAFLAVAAAAVALTLIDLEHQRLPLPITGAAACFAVPAVMVEWLRDAGSAEGITVAGVWSSAWPSLAGSAIWLLLFFALWLGSSGRAMGFGDVVLSPLLGLVLGVLGVGSAVVGLAVAFGLGAIVGVVVMAFGRRTAQPHAAAPAGADTEAAGAGVASVGDRGAAGTAVPFGPFMLAGWLVATLVGEPLWDAYLSMTGLA